MRGGRQVDAAGHPVTAQDQRQDHRQGAPWPALFDAASVASTLLRLVCLGGRLPRPCSTVFKRRGGRAYVPARRTRGARAARARQGGRRAGWLSAVQTGGLTRAGGRARAGGDERPAARPGVQAQQRVRGAGGLLRPDHERAGDARVQRGAHAAQGGRARGACQAHLRGAAHHGPLALARHAGAPPPCARVASCATRRRANLGQALQGRPGASRPQRAWLCQRQLA